MDFLTVFTIVIGVGFLLMVLSVAIGGGKSNRKRNYHD
jgi:hypothetical protein